jgi:hypothetical protein
VKHVYDPIEPSNLSKTIAESALMETPAPKFGDTHDASRFDNTRGKLCLPHGVIPQLKVRS